MVAPAGGVWTSSLSSSQIHVSDEDEATTNCCAASWDANENIKLPPAPSKSLWYCATKKSKYPLADKSPFEVYNSFAVMLSVAFCGK